MTHHHTIRSGECEEDSHESLYKKGHEGARNLDEGARDLHAEADEGPKRRKVRCPIWSSLYVVQTWSVCTTASHQCEAVPRRARI